MNTLNLFSFVQQNIQCFIRRLLVSCPLVSLRRLTIDLLGADNLKSDGREYKKIHARSSDPTPHHLSNSLHLKSRI